jgi:hypothetical protein
MVLASYRGRFALNWRMRDKNSVFVASWGCFAGWICGRWAGGLGAGGEAEECEYSEAGNGSVDAGGAAYAGSDGGELQCGGVE